jgi:ArsR family transcriptional regulator
MAPTTLKATATAGDQPAMACCLPGADPAVTAPVVDDDVLAMMTKALGHPARVRIVRLLAERQACMTGDLVAELPLAQSTISEHLRILRAAGLVQGEIEGPRTSYCLNRAGLAALQGAISSLAGPPS